MPLDVYFLLAAIVCRLIISGFLVVLYAHYSENRTKLTQIVRILIR